MGCREPRKQQNQEQAETAYPTPQHISFALTSFNQTRSPEHLFVHQAGLSEMVTRCEKAGPKLVVQFDPVSAYALGSVFALPLLRSLHEGTRVPCTARKGAPET